MELAWPLEGADDLREQLLAAYAGPERGYHDLTHLAEVLQRLAELGCTEPTVLLAAWFHDAVYGEGEDEERSARLAEATLSGLLPDAEVVAVAHLVRMTAHHRPDPDDHEAQLLSDADLAILAAPAERYAAYVAGVRAEYAAYDDATFRSGRATVLRDLLAKPSLFHTVYAQQHWEAPARANVEAELSTLEA
ncbi:hypothetical protein D9V37_15305 [Nocardioides mangrovicus]|uniref:Metal-dependent phosphohydrolase n=1 Tax=Nocardioides mangrovicus TaxID=2478913 RepID=A0A3L8NXX7_9ACTN|nr:hypothetical protein [Nocardioides mangrovicus]RLV47542.1 hypothetical protein D9V37_15305 [Nocardioides mangrovicus]